LRRISFIRNSSGIFSPYLYFVLVFMLLAFISQVLQAQVAEIAPTHIREAGTGFDTWFFAHYRPTFSFTACPRQCGP
jgi:hypothetical protein